MAAKRSGARGKRSQRTNEPLQPVQEPRSEPPLSRERIVATAVELLDAQGVDGLTMRRLADRLGSGVMSLYWHVDNKEDVFDLALDSVLEYRAPPQAAEPARLARRSRSYARRLARQHAAPSLVGIAVAAPGARPEHPRSPGTAEQDLVRQPAWRTRI